MNTPLPKKMSEAESLRAFADECVKSPAMYLMALRAHLNKGGAAVGEAVGEILDSVAEALPRPVAFPVDGDE